MSPKSIPGAVKGAVALAKKEIGRAGASTENVLVHAAKKASKVSNLANKPVGMVTNLAVKATKQASSVVGGKRKTHKKRHKKRKSHKKSHKKRKSHKKSHKKRKSRKKRGKKSRKH